MCAGKVYIIWSGHLLQYCREWLYLWWKGHTPSTKFVDLSDDLNFEIELKLKRQKIIYSQDIGSSYRFVKTMRTRR